MGEGTVIQSVNSVIRLIFFLKKKYSGLFLCSSVLKMLRHPNAYKIDSKITFILQIKKNWSTRKRSKCFAQGHTAVRGRKRLLFN